MRYCVALSMLPNIGSVLAQNLLSYCGSCEQIFKLSKARLQRVPGIGAERAARIAESDVLRLADREMKFMADHHITPLFFTDENYPSRLRQCADLPVMLYYKGNANLNQVRVLGIIGTRKITDYGRQQTQQLVEALAGKGILVISGLAYGVDIQAHKACLQYGLPTVGVLGHGLQMLYPDQHKTTAKRMLEHGGLLTEFHSQEEFAPHNFPRRNRVVAGLCDALVVVESAANGGSMLTVRQATSYNREIFAVPGRLTDPMSAGCNQLIANNEAVMFSSAKDLLEVMHWTDGSAPIKSKVLELPLDLPPPARAVAEVLRGKGEVELDVLSLTVGLSSSEMAGLLLEMEMNNWIVTLPGKRYRLVH